MAGLTLTKGNNLSLTKSDPGLNKVHIGLGWDPRTTTGDAFCRVVNEDTDNEIVRYDLTEDAAAETCMIFSEIYRNNGDWKFRAVGQGYATGLRGIASDYGISLD